MRLRRSFKDNYILFEDFVTNMLGINADYNLSETDQKLGDCIVQFSHAVQAYNESVKETNSLIHQASKMARESRFQERLHHVIGNASFADELFELICKLSFPERVHGTLVTVARTSKTFENVTFHHKPSSATGTMPKSNIIISPASPTVPGPVLPTPNYETAQDVGLLIQTISRGRLLPKDASAWYTFGFVCCTDEEQERRLAGLYAALIQEATSLPSLFHELHQALETNSLVSFFIKNGYESFREFLPRLETFLSTPPEQRPSVWRLKQFAQGTESTEPPPCLQRDYGFKFCRQRDEVVRLKAIYSRMLDDMDPGDLHGACLYGRLLEAAMREGVVMEAKDKRLLNNEFPSPFVGFDNNAGLANRGPLFKKQEKL